MIIGLGTGSTAGWLGVVPGMEHVDVVELEPAILEVARMCAAGNQNVMSNPKVRTTIGDAREALLTTPNRYDLIFSEPSNPYRAGIASLYTQDFYRACAKRLNSGGLFIQWLQAYEVDGQTVRTVYASLASVFPWIETWRTQSGDMLLMASAEPIRFDVPMMRERMKQEPFRSGFAKIWRVIDLEGVFARHMANSDFANSVTKAERGRVNTDDQNIVEFSFARSVGRPSNFGSASVHSLAEARGESRPVVTGGDLDWDAVEDRRVTSYLAEGDDPPMSPQRPREPDALKHRRFRVASMAHLIRGNSAIALEQWKKQPRPPSDLTERLFLAGAYADQGSDEAIPHLEYLRPYQPTESDALMAHLRTKQRRYVEAVEALESTFAGYHRDPWPQLTLMRQMHTIANDLSRADPTGNAGKRFYVLLDKPFALDLLNDLRMKTLVQVAAHIDTVTGTRLTADAVNRFEPHVPWDLPFLTIRRNAYMNANHPLTMLAATELDDFVANEPFPFDLDLVPELPPATQPTTGPATGPTTGPTTLPSLNLDLVPAGAAPPPGRSEPAPGGGNAPPAGQQPFLPSTPVDAGRGGKPGN
jgi:hypothetical protein